ncbi:MAG: copper transporter [Clostridium sp.]|nr:copper transporter [Clostridium sp.]
MHINMKYYIVSIGAIFIALGIGMLVGFNLNYDQEMSKQQANIISDLDKKFDNLKEKNDTLEQDLAKITEEYNKSIEFIDANFDKILVNELLDKNIGVISTNQSEDYTKDIEETIVKANGNIAFNIAIKNTIYDEKKLEEVSTKLGLEIKDANDIVTYILDSLNSTDAKVKLASLEELELIKVNDINNEYMSYDSVVLAGGSDSKTSKDDFEKIDKFLISKLKEEKKSVVGVQKSTTTNSYIELYSNEKVSTVDNIEQKSGKLAMVMLLKDSNILGNYGILDTAQSILPYQK